MEQQVDVAIIGAGSAGLYALDLVNQSGLGSGRYPPDLELL